jgi:hypothetical protein
MACKRVVCECPVSICGRVLPANLVVLPMFSYNVILGMDWLARHLAVINCARKQVTLMPCGEVEVTYVESRVGSLPQTILAIWARKLIIGGGQAFLTFVVAPTKHAKKDLLDILVVYEYPDVFLADYSRLPPQREVEFEIEFVLGIIPISKAPYRMAPSKLNELKEKLHELREKGFICPSTSP